MRKVLTLFTFLAMLGMQVMAQRQITGTVTNADDGNSIPGASVFVKGNTTVGTITDVHGKFALSIPSDAKILVVRFVGMETQEVQITNSDVYDVQLKTASTIIEGVVVTALGITREKKSLGYATQQVSGTDVNTVKSSNFINSLSGKVSGVQIRNNNNLGGSTNMVIRGYKSLTGNNQAMFVIDGIPINNDNTNNAGQIRGRNGYDYGSTAADINPNDIENINILKGAAATALYGSRAANGVVMITTKKGAKKSTASRNLGVGISSNITVGFIDKSTFPKYQTQYGGGYGATFYSDTTLSNGQSYPGFEYVYDIDGDGINDWTVPTYEDASYGQKFDENVLVYQWDSFYPESPNYKKATPWKAAENGPSSFFENSLSLTNSVDITGGGEATTFRLSYTNQNEKGIMPNSSLKKNSFLFNGTYDILKNLKASASANFIGTRGKGRNSTGYSDNILSSFRQWSQMNVDYKELKELYDKYHKNITWNPVSPDELAPAYWDNPYWVRYENYESDRRDRFIGFTQLDYKATDYLSFMGRISIDTYTELQEERKNIGSSSGEFGVGRYEYTSGYSRFDKSFIETNLDFQATFNKNLTENLSLRAVAGVNHMYNRTDQMYQSTQGGLIVPGIYSLTNSYNLLIDPEEWYKPEAVNGVYGSFSLGYKELLYLDGTLRRDWSSTLPKSSWSYNYPAISGSFIFSNLLKDYSWLQFGKLSLNYAEVGNYAPWGSLVDTYRKFPSMSSSGFFSVPDVKNNPFLKPERTKNTELGLQMSFLDKRIGFDLSLYRARTVDQILPVVVSFATGYTSMFKNAGEIENKGIELTINGTPVKNNIFSWDVILNWSKNTNKVISLIDGVENLQLAPLQGGVTINARVGEPYGVIQGTDYVYHDGQKVIGSNGYYVKSGTSDIVLGNINPDWNGGITNKFHYKNWSFSFLIDWQKGGSVFSLDMYYGLGTGLYEETAGTNDLGNPYRDPIVKNPDGTYASNSGGVLLDGVVKQADGTYIKNTKRVAGDDYRVWGWSKNPNAAFVYDASYIKLREIVISYSLPERILAKTWIRNATFSIVGSNLWIIHKNLPYADPEASQGAGNVQGWQSGVMPTTRTIGCTISLQF